MRRLSSYVKKYGPEFGPVYYHTLQSQSAHAGVSARLRRKLDILTGKAPAPSKPEPMPLFDGSDSATPQDAAVFAIGA